MRCDNGSRSDKVDSTCLRNIPQHDIASDPARSACLLGKRLPCPDHPGCEKVPRYNEQIAHHQSGCIVTQQRRFGPVASLTLWIIAE